MVSALILLAALTLIGLIATLVEIHRDGYRTVATDWTRVAERDAEAAPSIVYR